MEDVFKNMGIPAMDINAMMNAYKKNLETIHTANQVAADVMNSLSGLQNKFMQQTLEDVGSMMHKIMDPSAALKPTDALKEQSKMNQESWTKTMNHGKELAEMMSKTGAKVSDILRKRVSEHMDEVSTDWSANFKKTKH
jgi:phasin family protein